MQCNFCEWRCELGKERLGLCRMYYQEDGVIRERFPGQYSACGPSRIESVPFYHAYPSSRSLVLGTLSCNFSCRYCSNGFVARREPEEIQDQLRALTPSEIIRTAWKLQCRNIVFNVNEPTVSLPTLLDLGKAALAENIPLGCLTNGYATEESAESLASVCSFINVGLKGLSDTFYREYIGVKSAAPVLRNIRTWARFRHVEVTTPVIQGTNDHELAAIAGLLAEIDPEIPWHVFRFLPEHEMKEADYPNIDRIDALLDAARQQLHYVYFHNFVGSDWVDTLCPKCGTKVIERFSLGCGGDRLKQVHGNGRDCPACSSEIKMLGEIATPFLHPAPDGVIKATSARDVR